MQVTSHFWCDGIGLGNASFIGLQLADRDGGAAAAEPEWRVILAVGGFENFSFEGSVAVADSFVFGGAILPEGEAVGDGLQFGELPCAIGEGCFCSVNQFAFE
ncbi:MAG: hypothetical protein WCL46_08800 [Chlorobium sp.]